MYNFWLLNSEHFVMEEVTMLQIQIIGYCRFLKECPQITHWAQQLKQW